MNTKKKIAIGSIICICVIAIIFGTFINVKTYIKKSEIKLALEDDAPYVNKYIKINGVLVERVANGNDYVFAFAYGKDLDDGPSEYAYVYIPQKKSKKLTIGDYVSIDGKIISSNEYCGLSIKTDKAKKMSYIKDIHKTQYDKKIDKTVNISNISYKIDKVEYAKNETRVYTTITNKNIKECSVPSYSSMLDDGNGDLYYAELPHPLVFKEYKINEKLRVKSGETIHEIIRFPYKLDKNKTYTFSTEINIYDTLISEDIDISI